MVRPMARSVAFAGGLAGTALAARTHAGSDAVSCRLFLNGQLDSSKTAAGQALAPLSKPRKRGSTSPKPTSA
jgi:hypothetical protein